MIIIQEYIDTIIQVQIIHLSQTLCLEVVIGHIETEVKVLSSYSAFTAAVLSSETPFQWTLAG
ncbi:hypothetical protein [Methanococcoides sp. NM1]|uniref:hypothetical protein n=1 Tax=Methanococcoides sp. NM1 TaxID=1201013 RepID=UPI0014384811|nr:hypothetical protein [Methanococcoides sp. NM1]